MTKPSRCLGCLEELNSHPGILRSSWETQEDLDSNFCYTDMGGHIILCHEFTFFSVSSVLIGSYRG